MTSAEIIQLVEQIQDLNKQLNDDNLSTKEKTNLFTKGTELFSTTTEKLKKFKSSKEPKSELLYNKLSKTVKDEEKVFKQKKTKFKSLDDSTTKTTSFDEPLGYVDYEQEEQIQKSVKKKPVSAALKRHIDTEHDIARETLKEIKEIGEGMKEIQEMTNDLNNMVVYQGEQMNDVEDFIEEVEFSVSRGMNDVEKASDMHPGHVATKAVGGFFNSLFKK
eukprot:gene444-6857_t